MLLHHSYANVRTGGWRRRRRDQLWLQRRRRGGRAIVPHGSNSAAATASPLASPKPIGVERISHVRHFTSVAGLEAPKWRTRVTQAGPMLLHHSYANVRTGGWRRRRRDQSWRAIVPRMIRNAATPAGPLAPLQKVGIGRTGQVRNVAPRAGFKAPLWRCLITQADQTIPFRTDFRWRWRRRVWRRRRWRRQVWRRRRWRRRWTWRQQGAGFRQQVYA